MLKVIQRDEDVGAAPAREPSVVRSSFGRLRAHLPHWTGDRGEDLVAEVRRLPGVTDAAASAVTGNVLILFEPRTTSVAGLLDALPALRLPPLLPEVVQDGEAVEAHEPQVSGPVGYKTGLGRIVYKALGWASVGMAVVGAITPGIPTAPFVVLAGYFFIRSSPEAHRWLRRSRWFGKFLRDWEAYRGIRRSVRNAAAGLIVAGAGLTALLGLSAGLTVTIWALQAVGLAIVLRLRVIDPAAPTPAIEAV
jgi:uncharacterized membrane protein YbaN (DUF454 family)